MTPFLQYIAQYIHQHHEKDTEHLCIVLPNKRGALYLKQHLAKTFQKTIWLPTIISAEELVAELSAAFLCAELQITNTHRSDHAQYIANWLTVLKSDTKAIFTAASLATRAVAYLNDLQPSAVTVHVPGGSEANAGNSATAAAPDRPQSIDAPDRRNVTRSPK